MYGLRGRLLPSAEGFDNIGIEPFLTSKAIPYPNNILLIGNIYRPGGIVIGYNRDTLVILDN